MANSPGDFFEASKDDQRKYLNQLLALVRRYSERPESSDDERLRWAKARFAASIALDCPFVNLVEGPNPFSGETPTETPFERLM